MSKDICRLALVYADPAHTMSHRWSYTHTHMSYIHTL